MLHIGLSFINNLISELQKLRQKVVTEIRSTKQLETDLDGEGIINLSSP
jgi:hypothetical protein